MAPSEQSGLRGIVEWVVIIVAAFLVMLLVRQFVICPYQIPTASMEPTIMVGDNIFAQKVSLELGTEPQVGDIVVFNNPAVDAEHEVLVKRVIARAGQTVDMRDGVVYVDGEALEEPYTQGRSYPLATQAPGVELSYPYTVPEGCVWMMGDNRENSADSRYFGAVSRDELIAVGVLRYWPLDRIGLL